MSAVSKIDDIESLKTFIPLNRLDNDKLAELVESSVILKFRKDQPVFSGIEKTHNVYLLSGSVECMPNSPHSEQIKANSPAARSPILTPESRSRVVALNFVTVLCVDSELLDMLLDWGVNDGFEVDEIDGGESSEEWMNGFIQSDTALSLPPQGIQALMSAIEPIELDANEVIFNVGEKPDYYYIISSGRCVVTRRESEQGAPIELATLGAGEAFGEEALIADTVRGATVKMIEKGLLLRLDQRNFKKLLEESLVNFIDIQRFEKLKNKGAVVLDLRPVDDFAKDGSGVNIPFATLRSQLESLDKEKKYIVVSDNNKMSAVGAFLLSKKRFKVYVLKAAAKEEIAAQAAEVGAQAKYLEAKVSQLKQQLSESNSRLLAEENSHFATKARISALQAEIKNTQDQAKKAIVEAGALRSKSESLLRGRINELSAELEKEKQQGQVQIDEIRHLKSELASLENQLQQWIDKTEKGADVESLLQIRINNLANELAAEKKNLQTFVDENGALKDELESLECRLKEAREQAEQNVSDAGDTQSYEAELNVRIDELQTELQQLQETHKQILAEKDSIVDRASESEQAVAQLKLSEKKYESELASLNKKLERQSGIVKERDLLLEKTGSLEVKLGEIKARLSQAEVDNKRQTKQFEKKLKNEKSQFEKEVKEINGELSREQLRNKVLNEELSVLREQGEHSGIFMKSVLLIVMLAAGLVLGAMAYTGVDIQAQAMSLFDRTVSQFINNTVNSIFKL